MAWDDGDDIYSEQQLVAMRAVGTRVVNRNGRRVVEPAYGAKVVRDYLLALRPEEDDAAAALFADVGMSKDARKAFLARNRFVRTARGKLTVQNRFPGLTNETLDDLPRSVAGDDETLIVDERVRKYTLVQFFTDVQVRDKYRLSLRRIQLVTRLATSDPHAAASMLTSIIQGKGYPNVTVSAGSYANSLIQASQKIFAMAEKVQYKDSAARSLATPDELIIEYDEFAGRETLWRVNGPLRYAREVMAIYQLAINYGPKFVIGALGMPTLRLNIEIYDCRTKMVENGQLDGYVELMGVEPQNSAYPADLTAKQVVDLHAAVAKIEPVRVDSKVVGTAVRVSERMLLMNTHTIAAAAENGVTPMIAEEPVLFTRGLENDMCVTEVRGNQALWNIRTAKMGEKVVLCFHVGTHVEFSEVLRVRDMTTVSLVLSESMVLRRGCSGAAVIALADAAFLGIFSTKSGVDVICSAFTPAVFLRATDVESVASSEVRSSSPSGYGDITYKRLVDRGHKSRLAVLSKAITTVYAHDVQGFRVPQGVMARFPNGYYTTKTVPSENSVVAEDGRVEFADANMYSVECKLASELTSLKEVEHVREVQIGERVCILAKNGSDVVMSKSCTVMDVQAQFFLTEGFTTNENLAGGLIISMRDAAVLGLYHRSTTDLYGDTVSICARLPDHRPEDEAVVILRSWLTEHMQFDLPLADKTMMGLVFEPQSELLQYYKQLGQATARVAILHTLHDSAVPLAQWSVATERISGDAAVAKIVAVSKLRDVVGRVSNWAESDLVILLWAILGYISTFDESGFRIAIRVMQLDGADELAATPVGSTFVSGSGAGLPREPSDTTVGRASGEFAVARKSVGFSGLKPG